MSCTKAQIIRWTSRRDVSLLSGFQECFVKHVDSWFWFWHVLQNLSHWCFGPKWVVNILQQQKPAHPQPVTFPFSLRCLDSFPQCTFWQSLLCSLTMALVPVPLMSSIQVYLAPLLQIDRVIQDLQEVKYELQDLEETLADLNLPGVTPPMLALSMPIQRLLTAAKLHRLCIIVQLQRNLRQHWRVHFCPPLLDLNLMWRSCRCHGANFKFFILSMETLTSSAILPHTSTAMPTRPCGCSQTNSPWVENSVCATTVDHCTCFESWVAWKRRP